MSELPVGTSINDSWVVQSVLFPERASEGAIYVVVKRDTEQTFLCQDVGPTPTGADAEARKSTYQKAIDVVRSTPHPNLAPVVETFTTGGREYVVLDAPHQASLESVAHANGEAGNRTLREWGNQICDAFGALDGKLPCLLLDHVDPAQIMGDGNGHFRLVNYHLGRCLNGSSTKVLGETNEDRAVNYNTCAELLSFVATKKKSKTDLASVKAFNPKLAAVVQRCQAFLQYPGLSFQEIKRSLWQALPEEAVEKRSKLQMEGLGLVEILKGISLRTYLSIATGIAVIAVVWNLFQTRIITWPIKNSAIYVVCNANVVDFVDGDTYEVEHKVPVNSMQPDLNDIKIVANGQRLLVLDRGMREVQCFGTGNHKTHGNGYGVEKLSYPPIVMLDGSTKDRSVFVIGGGHATELGVSPVLMFKRDIALGNVAGDSVYAMTPDHTYIFSTLPRLNQIRVTDVPDLKNLHMGMACPTTQPSCMAVSPDGKELWVGSASADSIYVLTLDPLLNSQNTSLVSTLKTIQTADTDFRPSHIEFSDKDKGMAAITSPDTDELALVNCNGHRVENVVKLAGRHPVSCVFTADGANVLVSCEDSDSVDVVTTNGGTVIKSFKVSGSPTAIQFAVNSTTKSP